MRIMVAIAIAIGFTQAGCPGDSRVPLTPLVLTPAADTKARADLQESIDGYVRTAPRIQDFRAVLNPKMQALQGNPADPVPSNLGLLRTVPAPTPSGLAAFSPVIVKAVRARLRDTLHRAPSDDEVVAEIQTTESKPRDDVVAALESRRAAIVAIYTDAAALNQQGRGDEAALRMADVRKLRASIIQDWQIQNGIAAGKSDTPGEIVSPDDTVAKNRELLGDYLNSGVDNSP